MVNFLKGLDFSIQVVWGSTSMGSAGQRDAKLNTSFQSWGSQKKACRSCPALVEPVDPGSNHSQSLMEGSFAAILPSGHVLPLWKIVNPFQCKLGVQEASIIRVCFTLLK